MDLYIDRDALGRGLARIQGIVERRTTHPLLGHVLLHARPGEGDAPATLRITATDTEVAYIGDIAANVEKPGDIAVDATSLFQIVRALPDPTVRLTAAKGNRLEIRSGRASFKLPGFAADDYPALPAFDARSAAVLTERDLGRLVDRTHFAVAQDDLRYGLNGVHLEQAQTEQGPRLRFVATDGHRLSGAEAPFEGELVITPRSLVPRKALAVIRKLLEGGDGAVEVSFGEGAIHLATREGAERFWFRLLDGEFPEYQAVVPKESRYRVAIRRSELASALRRVLILVQDRTRAVRFAFGADELRIDLQNADRGEVAEEVPVELEGEPVEVGFNPRYLQDVLSVLEGDRVVLELAHPLAACLLRDPDDESAFFVVMPMRLD